MRNELHNIELIEKYLRDELSGEDKKAFEERLKTDTKLQKEVELQKEVVKGIERIGVKQSIQKASRRYDNRRRGFFLGLFLFVIISGIVGINYLNNNSEPAEITSEDVVENLITITAQQIEDGEAEFEILDEQEVNSEAVSLPIKKFQYFTINSSKNETIIGAEGTKITFKANSFNAPKNSSLKIRLKEYYKMADIAFSNLTTETIDGKLLETGGMIYIDALANNKKVDLKKDAFFEIKFPFDKEKEDMLLFDGKTQNESVVWEEAKINSSIAVDDWAEVKESIQAEEIFTIVEEMPEFPGGQAKLFEYLGANVKYPKEAVSNSIAGKVYVNFTVREDGEVRDVKVIRGVHRLLDEEALRVVKSFPNWQPGVNRGKKVSVSYNIPINFRLNGATGGYTRSDIKYYNDSLISARLEDVKDVSVVSDNKKNKGEAKAVGAKKTNLITDANYYVLSGSNLGFINCDRFVRGGRRIKFKLNVGSDNVQVKLIFHDIKSMMGDLSFNKTAYFNYIPEGAMVTAFAVKFIDNKPFVCFQEMKISTTINDLQFEELTIERLKEYKEKINSL